MAGYEFLEHTADVKFRATGKTIEEALTNVVMAVTAVLIEPDKVSGNVIKKITIRATSIENLLYDMIAELVFLLDTEGFISSRVVKLSLKGKENIELIATLEGDNVKNYPISGDIKAATYNEMNIEEKDGWTIEAVLDI